MVGSFPSPALSSFSTLTLSTIMSSFLQSNTLKAVAFASLSLLSAKAQLAGQLGVLDLEANGGINPATGAAWEEGDQYRLIFLSSTVTDAMSSDIATYNTFVQSTAAASTAFPELGGASWFMMGSTLTVDARDNTGTNPTLDAGVPVFLMDGTSLLATNNSELWRAPSAVAVVFDENGTEVSNPSTRVFTGSFNDGTGVGPGGGGGSNGDGTGSGDTALGVLDGRGVQTGQPFHTNNPGLELQFWIREWKHPAADPLPVYAISEPLSVVPAVSFELAIRSIEYSAATSEVTLTWDTRPEDLYVVKYSTDMVDWSGQIHEDFFIAEGSQMVETFDLSDLAAASSGPIFFRVEQLIPQ